MKPGMVAVAARAIAVMVISTIPATAETADLQERRLLMRQVTQQQQARLEQRLRCINAATNLSELDSCQRTAGAGWHHGPGMGGWGCPMW